MAHQDCHILGLWFTKNGQCVQQFCQQKCIVERCSLGAPSPIGTPKGHATDTITILKCTKKTEIFTVIVIFFGGRTSRYKYRHQCGFTILKTLLCIILHKCNPMVSQDIVFSYSFCLCKQEGYFTDFGNYIVRTWTIQVFFLTCLHCKFLSVPDSVSVVKSGWRGHYMKFCLGPHPVQSHPNKEASDQIVFWRPLVVIQ